MDWGFSADNLSVECMYNEILSKLQSISDKVPDSVLKTNVHGDILEKLPWDCSKLVKKRKEKDKSWNSFDISPTMTNFQTALQKQDDYQKCEFAVKIKYEKKIISKFKTNSRPYYNYLKSKCKLRKTVGNLKDPVGNLTKSPQETANVLADFFQSVFTPEEYGPLTEECYKSRKCINNIMSDLSITPADVKKLLLALDINKSMGPDNVHPKLLKYLATNNTFVDAVTLLLNKCLHDETIPSIWKTASVIALHKKGSVHNPGNYRPVSLTCIMCKLYEKIIRKHLLLYVADIINSKQHGFVKGKSCASNLLEALDSVNDIICESGFADILYFDFAKAFDTVSHYRLLIKLEAMGICPKFLNIIRNFLSDRTMQVSVGDSKSQEKSVLSGVPQGSVLGPLLFLLFINDLPEGMKQLVKLFADDVKMIVNPNHMPEIQLDLEKLCIWESVWLLKFNTDKCFVLHIGKHNPENKYIFSSSTLKTTDKEKDLGVIFNRGLDFSDAISAFVSKAKSCLFWFLRNTLSRDPDVMVRAYKSIVRPHLEYCAQVWSPKARHGNWGTILEIEDVQRTFTRMVSGMDGLSYEERLKKLKLTTLFERRMRGDLIETYKILNKKTNYGAHFFNLSTRTSNLVAKPGNVKNNDFFSDRVIHFYNKLPQVLKSKESVNSFKNNLDEFRII